MYEKWLIFLFLSRPDLLRLTFSSLYFLHLLNQRKKEREKWIVFISNQFSTRKIWFIRVSTDSWLSINHEKKEERKKKWERRRKKREKNWWILNFVFNIYTRFCEPLFCSSFETLSSQFFLYFFLFLSFLSFFSLAGGLVYLEKIVSSKLTVPKDNERKSNKKMKTLLSFSSSFLSLFFLIH